MKYMIISDIHGSEAQTERAVDVFKAAGADFLFILGDVLYHGPRNPLPNGHNPKDAAEILNSIADKIIAVRGNCDSEVDQFVLKFPCMGDYTIVVDEGRALFLTHGHIFDEKNLPPNLAKGSFFMSGHTHIIRAEEKNGVYFCNPGSISLPKSYGYEPAVPTFAMYENGVFSVFPLSNPEKVLMSVGCRI
jgi:putative phosphoesterase